MILHLCRDFPFTSLYKKLVASLSKLGVCQHVYVALRSPEYIGTNSDVSLTNVNFTYSSNMNTLLRFLYFKKIKVSYNDILNKIEIDKISLIHSHFLFSDGGVAYLLKKRNKIPYITAVRNTDVNFFFKYFVHTRKFGIKILENSEKVIFLSPKYLEYTINTYVPIHLRPLIRSKSLIIPNGIDDYWLTNAIRPGSKPNPTNELRFIIISQLTKNKNIHKSIKIIKKLKQLGHNVYLDIIGPKDDYYITILKLVEENKSYIKYQ